MPSGELSIHRRITYNPDIALAVYRELASHLEQIDEVNVALFWQERTEFRYLGSQIGGFWLSYPQNLSARSHVLIENILNCYGNWTSET
ncbi:MAG: hypothetical protein ACK48A_01200 [Pseudanabaena sp.]